MTNVTTYGYVRAMPVRIQVLTIAGATPIVPVGLLDLLRKCGQLAEQFGVRTRVDTSLVAADPRRKKIRSAGDLALECHHHLGDAPRADFVIVSPLDPEVLDLRSRDANTLAFLHAAHGRGSTLASVCTGAFVLAETGLLDGRRAATHWAFQDLFRARFPSVDLQPQDILVDEGRFVTTGGATAFLDFALYMAERLYGPELARAAARMFLIDHKAPQGAYAIFSAQKQHGDADILTAQTLIERSGGRALSVEDLAAKLAMSRRTFIRRFKAATGGPPREYLQRACVEAAKRRLESTRESIAEVARAAGYEDLTAFRRLFLRHTGLTPSDYRHRYASLRNGVGG